MDGSILHIPFEPCLSPTSPNAAQSDSLPLSLPYCVCVSPAPLAEDPASDIVEGE
jgi:hypothetical protein